MRHTIPCTPKEARKKSQSRLLTCPNCHGGVVIAFSGMAVQPSDSFLNELHDLRVCGAVILTTPEIAEENMKDHGLMTTDYIEDLKKENA